MTIIFWGKLYRILIHDAHYLSSMLRIILNIYIYTLFILILSLLLQKKKYHKNLHRKSFLILISFVLVLTHFCSNQSIVSSYLFFFFLFSFVVRMTMEQKCGKKQEAKPENIY